ncbi:GntR family transcriptional regulator [Alicyclobacillus fastidiosus]|uniref:GntR family transcriptional regulator n=1 Tax=Alicyclobacillus fastidiosus TaxID=392011 RepID=A0ABV5A9T8_9BACL|nr:GntR family transcriptional regulator [Alicyclobacillus fastidiosus]WEH10934.1 GntR family transcriptional regulator [Alicyclobacillus fastidiosus]
MKTSVPLYQHLKNKILKDIQDGKWHIGDKIPSESELAEEMGVSRITVRQAIRDLVSLGYLIRRQGKGTYLVGREQAFAASKLHGFAEELRSHGHAVEIELKGIHVTTCPMIVAEFLGVKPSSDVIQIRRLAKVEGTPIFRETSYLVPPPQLNLDTALELRDVYNHVYGFFEQYGVKISFGRQEIYATRAVYEDIQELSIKSDEPILMIRRVTSDETGTPVEFSEVRYASSRYHFEVKLSRE